MAQSADAIIETPLDRHAVVPAAVSLIRRHCDSQYKVPRLSLAARLSLSAHSWTGSMDELDHCVRQALVLCNGAVIQAEDLRLEQANAQRVQSVVMRSIRAANGVRSVAAKNLGISTRTLREQLAGMRAQGLPIPESAPARSELYHD